MSISFKKSELIGSSYVKTPLRTSALASIGNDDKYCFIWYVLARLHSCENSNPKRVSNYKQYFIELKISGFNISNGFKGSDMHKFEKLNSLSINLFELNFYQELKKMET